MSDLPPYLQWQRGLRKHFAFKWGQVLGDQACPYMRRWALIAGLFSIRLHHFYRPDDSRAFHDHPWWFVTLVLGGGYTDYSTSGTDYLHAGSVRFRGALHRHRVRPDWDGCWTLVLTGPNLRKWGFWLGGRFKSANDYFREYGHPPCADD